MRLTNVLGAPRLRRQRLAYATDAFVPPLMAPFVVVTLEVIYIDHCKGNGLMLALVSARRFGISVMGSVSDITRFHSCCSQARRE